MSDPFASLDPIGKPKTPAQQVLAAPQFNHHHGPPATPVAPLGMQGNMYGAPGMGMGMGMGQGMGMAMGQQGMMNPMGMGQPSMGQQGMGMGMGGMQPNPFQQQQQQQPIMYDNIKNLLQQKPKQPEPVVDSASMDFLENLGGGGGAKTNSFGAKTNSFGATASPVRAAEPVHSISDPFGGGSAAAPMLDAASLGIFETGSTHKTTPPTNSPSGGGVKSSALADRLANGRRKTQEMQRSQLNFNAQSFANTTGVAKISLKDVPTGGSAHKAQDAVDLDFGSSSTPSSSSATNDVFGSDDIFGGSASASHGSNSRNGSGQFPATHSASNAANTFW